MMDVIGSQRWYVAGEIRHVTESDPVGFYTLQIRSDRTGEHTRWMNITREQLDGIAVVLLAAKGA